MAPIPLFPDFRRLEIRDRSAIEAVTRRFPPYSDFGFTSLWAWDTDETCALSSLAGNLVVRFKDYTTDAHFYSFLGDHAVIETVRALLARAGEEGLPPCLKLVPEAVIAAEPRLQQLLTVEEDRDNFDYVYPVADWVSLVGPPFQPHRRKIARCRRRAALDFRLLDPRDAADQRAMIALFHRWAAQKPAPDGDDHRQELAAFRRLFVLDEDVHLIGCGLFDGADLVGFSVSEGLPGSDYAVAHFQKTDRSYVGLTALLLHEESRVVRDRGHRFMNIEQDLGVPGLRRHKRSLRPCRFLRKYVISEFSHGLLA